jgi:hypothetical protein
MNKNSSINNDGEQGRYYFKTTGDEIDKECTEACMVQNNGIMIGSIACQECQHCIDDDGHAWDCSWIICAKIKEATTPAPPHPERTSE